MKWPFFSSRKQYRPQPRRASLTLEELEPRLAPAANVLTFHNDIASTGVNASEIQLTSANVKVGSFGKYSATTVDGQVYAQPLVMTGVNVVNGPNTKPGMAGVHDVVFVATEHDSLYAIDAAQGANGAILWQRTFLDLSSNDSLPGASSVTTLTSADVGTQDINPEIGITGTPVIDSNTNTLYLVVKSKEVVSGVTHFVQRLHAINVADGTDRLAPFVIGDTSNGNTNNTQLYVYGSGDGNVTDPYNGTGKKVMQFNALREHQRGALSLVNGKVYVNWASHGDNGPYHGMVAAWDVSNLTTSGFVLKGVFNTSPNGSMAGIWQGGGRLSFEADGSAFYFETGNASGGPAFSPDSNGFPTSGDYYEALLKLVPDSTTSPTNQNVNGWGFKVADYFIPYNQPVLDTADQDFGSGAPLVLPDSAGIPNHPHLMVASGKEGKIYLVDRDNMGKFNTNNDNVLNAVPDGSGHNTPPVVLSGSLSTPDYYNGKIYWVSGYSGTADTFTIGSNGILTKTSQTSATFGALPGSPSISSNGANNGIVWVPDRNLNLIHAYDASSFANELWNSGQKSGGADNLGAVVKFAVPTVANGQVFVGTSNSLVIYGLTPPATSAPNAPTLSATALSGSAINLSWTDPTQPPNTATGYLIEESSDNGSTYQQVSTAPAGTTSIAIGGLVAQKTYYFRIRGFNGLGNSQYSNVANATTTASQGNALDFSSGFAGSTTQLTYNGPAVVNGSKGQLTDGGGSEAASFFSKTAVDVTSFNTQFTFQIVGDGDGMTFTIQNQAPTALGQLGGGLGYGPDHAGGTGGIPNSIAIKFDQYSNEGEGSNSTGLYQNGAAPTAAGSIDLTSANVDLHSGHVFQVNAIYDGATLAVTIKDTQTGASATQNYTVNIPNVIGSNTAYVGFTAGTGGVTATHSILTWTYANSTQTNQAPTAPTALGATVASATSVNLNWTSNSSNQTGFHLDRATDANFTQNLITENLPASPNSFTDTATGLAPGGTFYYRLRAFNQAGDSGYSNQASVSIPLAPAKATDAQVTLVTASEVDLSWTDHAGRTATGYNVLRAVNHGSFTLYVTLPARNDAAIPTPSPTYTWEDTNVSPATFYEYHIQAFNVSGYNDFTGTNTTTLTLPPSNVTATASNAAVALSWAVPTGAVSYNVYRGTTAGGESSTPLASGLTATSYIDTTAVNGQVYYYEVTALNANVAPQANESAVSSEVTATPTAPGTGLDFSSGFAGSTSQLTYNGPAVVNGTKGQLTDGGQSEAASFFSKTVLDVSHFSTQFTFQIVGDGDGMTFTIQNQAATALGPYGGGLGYGPDHAGGTGGIANSIAIKFDQYSNEGEGSNSTGLYQNGAAPTAAGSIDLTSANINLHSGHVFQVNAIYDGTTLAVTIKDTQTGATATQNYSVNIPNVIGSNTAYVGFTAGTGGITATHSILTWTYASTTPTGQVPAAPTNSQVTSVTTGQVNLSWTDNAGSNASSYRILRAVNNGAFATYATLPGLTTTPPTTYTWNDTSVSAGTLYQYQIVAVNAAGSSNSVTASATTLTQPPGSLTATAGNNAVALSWTAPTGAVSYNVYRGTSASGESSTPIASGVTATSYNDTTAVNGQVYYYKVTAFNANTAPLTRESAASNEASATPVTVGTTLDFSAGFAGSASQLTYNGPAVVNGTKGQLTDGGQSEAASFFSKTVLDVSHFSTQFTFQIVGDGDGMTFTIQNQAATALGPYGGGLGYGPDHAGGTGGIANSIAIKFDQYSNEGEGSNSTGLYQNGAAPTAAGSIDLTSTGLNLHSGHVFQVNAVYDGATLAVTIKDTQTNQSATQNYTVNIPNVIGSNTAYVGFTAGTGGITATHSILSWTYVNNTLVPASPTNAQVTGVTTAQVSLSWTDNAGSNASSYQVQRAVNHGAFAAYATLPALTTTPPSTYTWSDNSVSAGTAYDYRILAVNASGSSNFAATSANTLTVPPSGVTAQPGNAVVALSWTAPTGAVAYNVYRGTTAGGQSSTPIASGITTTSYNDTTALNNQTYYYKITALNANAAPLARESATSSEVSATPRTVPAAPTNAQVTGVTTAQVSLSWTDNAGSNAGSYQIQRAVNNGALTIYATLPGLTTTPPTTYTWNDNSVSAGTLYQYQIVAVNASGSSNFAATSANTLTVPPSGVTATPGNAVVALSWTAPTGAVAYNVYRGTTAGGQSSTPIASGITTTSYNDTTALNNQTYYYKITALNANAAPLARESARSSEVSARPIALPAAPINAKVTGVTTAQVDLSWTDNAGSTASSYQIQRAVNHGTFAAYATLPALTTTPPSTYTWSDKSVAAGTFYDYRILAVNASGSSNFAGTSVTTLTVAPSNVTAQAGNAVVALSWTAPTGAVAYNVYRGTTAGGESSTPIASGITTTSYNDTTALNNQIYYYKVTALNANTAPLARESARSSEVSATPRAVPAAPTNLAATVASNVNNPPIKLTWSASAGATSYKVYRATTSNGQGTTALATVTGTTFTDTTVVNATPYYYKVMAVNAAGQSLASNEVRATSLLSAHVNFSASTTQVPTGYLNDVGQAYGSRTNGLTYGWNIDNTANMRNRDSSASPDELHDSLAHMQKAGNTNAWWGIAVPNGTYQVHLIAGDPTANDSLYKINVSGGTVSGGQLTTTNPVLAINGTPTLNNRWIENTVTVTVTNGMLFISNAAGAVNNKICSIDIVQL